MSSPSRLLCACAGAVALGACESPSSPKTLVCTPNILFGVQVTVIDSLTNVPPSSATLIARSGAYVDSVGPEETFSPYTEGVVLVLSAAMERPGTYDLTVRSPGYRD